MLQAMETVRYIPVLCADEVEEDIDMPSFNHSVVTQNIGFYLQSHYRERYLVCQQLSLNLQGWDSIPDISVYRRGTLTADWRNDQEKVLLPPDLAIEVLSPKQHLSTLITKILRLLDNGVKSAWLVLPGLGQITIFHSDKTEKTFTEGILHDPIADIDMPLADVFE